MEQKRVSFKVAKAIREAGYNEPCDMYYHIYDSVYDSQMSLEMTGNGCADFLNSNNHYRCASPSYFDVWAWLSDKKHIFIDVKHHCINCVEAYVETKICDKGCVFNTDNVEDGIAKAIDYLVDSDLIK